MDFNDTPEEANFRKEVSDWLKENVKKIPEAEDTSENSSLARARAWMQIKHERSEEHTSEVTSGYLVCRLLLEKKKNLKQAILV